MQLILMILLLLPLEIFEKHPKILSSYQKQWKYVLVDEYQDTNLPQFLFVSKIAEKHQTDMCGW